MEFSNSTITVWMIILSVGIILNLILALYMYFTLRNRKGPQGRPGDQGPQGPPGSCS